MNHTSITRAAAFTLIQLMVSVAILASMFSMMGMALLGSLNWSSTGSAQDSLTSDVTRVWRTFNDDLVQSAWLSDSVYLTSTSQGVYPQTLAADRSVFYLPYVLQSAQGVGANTGSPSFALLAPFRRDQAGSIVYSGTAVAALDKRDADLPGSPIDRTLSPSAIGAANYRDSYFARSQELVFIRATTTLWNQNTQQPNAVSTLSPDKIPAPVDSFPGASAQWRSIDTTGALHNTLRVLHPSGWQDVSGVWTARPTPPWWPVGTPYGQVLEASRLYQVNSSFEPRLQLEEIVQPGYGQGTFAPQAQNDLRLMGYMMVPSPGLGLGRLVRVHTQAGTPPAFGTDVGRRVSTDALGVSLVINKVLSDNVVRILFETARHNDAIGINNIKVTVFFAKAAEGQQNNGPVVRQKITMIFAMHTDNSAQKQITMRDVLRKASTVVPFTY